MDKKTKEILDKYNSFRNKERVNNFLNELKLNYEWKKDNPDSKVEYVYVENAIQYSPAINKLKDLRVPKSKFITSDTTEQFKKLCAELHQ